MPQTSHSRWPGTSTSEIPGYRYLGFLKFLFDRYIITLVPVCVPFLLAAREVVSPLGWDVRILEERGSLASLKDSNLTKDVRDKTPLFLGAIEEKTITITIMIIMILIKRSDFRFSSGFLFISRGRATPQIDSFWGYNYNLTTSLPHTEF